MTRNNTSVLYGANLSIPLRGIWPKSKNCSHSNPVSFTMNYPKKTRDHREIENITTQSFQNHDEAYDWLASIYEDLCCSEEDYAADSPYHEIIEITDDAN